MSSKSYKCRVLLNQCLAIVVRKEGCRGDPGDFWMYENGYLLFQGLLTSNSLCWWTTPLSSPTLAYRGYVHPGALLVSASAHALDALKTAWARRLLQPPPGYSIVAVEEVSRCDAAPVLQTQWTPLPEAVCAVVLRLSRQGRAAGIAALGEGLMVAFPHVAPPSEEVLYETLVQLCAERKLYHSAGGYFIVTPERRRSRSASRSRSRVPSPSRTMLMSTEEALTVVHGDMATIRDGDVTHQLVQTNLADVICGGNAGDKILYPRSIKHRGSAISVPRSPERRGSFRLWRSTRRLRRSASTRTIARCYVESSSGTETSTPSTPSPKKESLLSRLFKKTKRNQCQISSFSAQFPPSEWFNSKAVHLHSIGTQTSSSDKEPITTTYRENCEVKPTRSATLPRRRPRPFLDSSRDTSPLSRTNSLSRKGKNKNRDVHSRTSQENSGPSSLDSHKTESSFNSGPSSLESHKTVINTKEAKRTIPKSNSFTLQVTTKGSKLNNKPNATTTTTINGEGGSSTKIFVQNSPVRSVITFENGQGEDLNPNLVIINDTERANENKPTKNTNQETTLNNSRDLLPNGETDQKNNRKLSLQLPNKENLSVHNLIKNLSQKSTPDSPQPVSKGGYNSTPPSPTKSTDALSLSSIYAKNEMGSLASFDLNKKLEKNMLGSEPNICTSREEQFPSLNDLSFNFTSLAAQKILKGVGLNSVDTLVELNMTVDKQNNCDVVHTDFGMV